MPLSSSHLPSSLDTKDGPLSLNSRGRCRTLTWFKPDPRSATCNVSDTSVADMVDPRKALVAYNEGFSDLDMAIRLDPSYAPARRHRGNMIVATYKARRALGQPTNDIIDRAIDDLKDAVELDPTSKTNANALGEAYLVKWHQRDAQVHIQVQVIEDLQLREQPDPRARNILGAPPNDKMPKGS